MKNSLQEINLDYHEEYDDSKLSRTINVGFVNLKKNSFLCEIAMLEKYVDGDLQTGRPVRLGDKGVFVVQKLNKKGYFATVSVVPLVEYRSKSFRSGDYDLVTESEETTDER